MQYDSAVTNEAVGTLTVTNSDAVFCGATVCSLRDVGCTNPISHADAANLAIDSATGAVTFVRNIIAGYGPVDFCVRCENTGSMAILDHDSLSVK